MSNAIERRSQCSFRHFFHLARDPGYFYIRCHFHPPLAMIIVACLSNSADEPFSQADNDWGGGAKGMRFSIPRDTTRTRRGRFLSRVFSEFFPSHHYTSIAVVPFSLSLSLFTVKLFNFLYLLRLPLFSVFFLFHFFNFQTSWQLSNLFKQTRGEFALGCFNERSARESQLKIPHGNFFSEYIINIIHVYTISPSPSPQ